MANDDSGMRVPRLLGVLVIALMLPAITAVGTAAVALYRISENETKVQDQEQRLRAAETSVAAFAATARAVEKQTEAIQALERQVSAMNERLPAARDQRDSSRYIRGER